MPRLEPGRRLMTHSIDSFRDGFAAFCRDGR